MKTGSSVRLLDAVLVLLLDELVPVLQLETEKSSWMLDGGGFLLAGFVGITLFFFVDELCDVGGVTTNIMTRIMCFILNSQGD
jgi:hypothetical protein